MNEGARLSVLVDAQTAGFARGMQDVSRRLGMLRRSQAQTVASTKVLERSIRDLTRELDRQSRSLALLTLQWVAFRNAVLTTAIRTAITGMASLTASVAALGSTLVQVTGGLGRFVTALGTVGVSGLAALAQGAVVATLALDGIGKALSSSGTDYEKAMQKLSKPARAFVRELKPIQMAMREIKLLAQAGLFPGLTRAARNIRPLLEPVKQIVHDTAEALGYLAERASEVARARVGDISALGQRNVVTLRRFGDAAIYVGEALIDVFRAADPLIGHVTRGMVTFARSVRDAARDARADGSLRDFFDEVRESYDRWTSILGNVGSALSGTFKASRGPARDLEEALDRITEKWATFANSAQGRVSMERFFDSSNKVMGSMARFAGAVAQSLGRLTIAGADNAVAFFDLLREDFLPILERFALFTNETVFPAFLELGRAIASFVRAAQPGLEAISRVFSDFVQGMASVISTLSGITSKLPGISGGLATLAVGAGILTSWRKLRLGIALALLEMRRFLGLAPEIAGMAAASRALLFQRGGRNQGLEGGNMGGPGVAPAVGMGARGASAVGEVTRSERRRAERARVADQARQARIANEYLRDTRDRAVGAGVGRVTTANRPAPTIGLPMHGPTRRVFGAAADPSRWAGATRQPSGFRILDPLPGYSGFRDRERVPMPTRAVPQFVRVRRPIDPSPSTERGRGAVERYRAATSIEPGKRNPVANMGSTVAAATATGLRKGAELSKPVLKGAFAFAAINGVLTGLTSGAPGIGNKLNDILSGATFGAIPSFAEKSGGRMADLQRQIASGQVSDSFWKRSGPLSAIASPIPGFDRAVGRETKTEGKFDLTKQTDLQRFRNEYIKALEDGKKITKEQGDELRALADQFRTAARLGITDEDLKLKGYDELVAKFDEIASSSRNAGRVVVDALSEMQSAGGGSLKDIGRTTSKTARLIARELGKGSAEGKEALALNYRLAIEAIGKSMDDGVIKTDAGIKKINGYLRDALSNMGIENIGDFFKGSVGSIGDAFKPSEKRARGGLLTLPGKPGPDSIPMNVAGRKILAAPGEDVAIVNRHQRKFLDGRLADVGGFPGVFQHIRTPHHQKAGGRDGFAEGGIVNLRGASPSLMKYARDAARYSLTVSSGLRPGSITSSGNPSNHGIGKAIDLAGAPGNMLRYGLHAASSYGRALEELIHTPMGFGIKNGQKVPPYAAADHYDHVHLADVDGGSGGIDAMVKAAKIKGVRSGKSGALGKLVDTALSRFRSAAQGVADKAASETALPADAGGAGGLSSAGGKFGKTELKELWTRAGGSSSLANLMAAIALAESSGNPAITNSIGARGLWQVIPSTARAFGFDWGRLQDPFYNAQAAVAIHAGQGLGAWEAYTRGMHQKFLARGGILSAATGALMPGRRDGVPEVDTDDAIPPASRGGSKKPGAKKKAKKKKKGRSPKVSGLKLPGLAKRVKAKSKKPWASSYKDLDISGDPAIPDGFFADYKARFDDPISSITSMMATFEGVHGLTDEQAIVTLFDSARHSDLTNYWNANPAEAELYRNDYDSWDVVNRLGMLVQGKHVRGIDDRLAELFQIARLYDNPAGLFALLGGKSQHLGVDIAKAAAEERDAQEALTMLRTYWETEKATHTASVQELRHLRAGGLSWEDRVATNNENIKRLRAWKARNKEKVAGNSTSKVYKRNVAKADRQIREMLDENEELKTKQPAPIWPKPKKPKKGASKQEQARYRARLRDWEANRRYRNEQTRKVTGRRDDARQEMQFLAGNTERWDPEGGIAGGYSNRKEAYADAGGEFRDALKGLVEQTIPQTHIEFAQLAKEINEWNGTDIIRPKPRDGKAESEAAIAALRKDQNDMLARENYRLSQMFGVFSGFKPLADARLVGAFQHGGVIPETGLALVHKNETVIPDPGGPFFNRASAGQAQAGPVYVVVNAHGDLGAVMRKVDARIEQVAPRAVSRQLGTRRATIKAAPGTR